MALLKPVAKLINNSYMLRSFSLVCGASVPDVLSVQCEMFNVKLFSDISNFVADWLKVREQSNEKSADRVSF